MENEMTYEQWEIGVKEDLASLPTEELLLVAESAATAFTSALLVVNTNILGQEEPVEVDEGPMNYLKKQIAIVAVIADVLQLRFGDVAEQEMECLEELRSIIEE